MENQNITVRQTKTVRDCSVGAMCRTGSECFVPCDTRFWVDKDGKPVGNVIPLIRTHLKNFLDSKGFPSVKLLQAPTFSTVEDRKTGKTIIKGDRIPAVRFPSWMRCLKCGLLHYLPWVKYERTHGKKIDSIEYLNCSSVSNINNCKGKLEFVTWVLISSEGYLDDIPWNFLAHRAKNKNKDCKSGDRLYLNRNFAGQLELRCRSCNDTPVNINGIRDNQFFEGLPPMRKQPWLQEKVQIKDLSEPPIAVKITDVRLHIPDVASALDIPPESRISEEDVRIKIQQLDDWNFIKPHEKIDRRRWRRLIKTTAIALDIDSDEVNKALDDIENGWLSANNNQNNHVATIEKMVEAEYQALSTPYDDFKEGERFITEHQTSDWKDLIQRIDIPVPHKKAAAVIDRLVIVKKVREIQVFCGFFRKEKKESKSTPPNLTGSPDWLPACELYGEGIFFSFDEKQLNKWEQMAYCKDRASVINKRLEKATSNTGLPKPSPRLILLHTISHIMIKQLEFSAGYPVSSIKEKIFCSDNKDSPMSGILIYLVVPDKMGSLGGLAEHGKPERFLKLWLKSIEKAEYCTYDPICSEHEGQGPDQLNRAACHGCSLLPEVSCMYNNCLLDRKFIIGSNTNDIQGFIKYVQD